MKDNIVIGFTYEEGGIYHLDEIKTKSEIELLLNARNNAGESILTFRALDSEAPKFIGTKKEIDYINRLPELDDNELRKAFSNLQQ